MTPPKPAGIWSEKVTGVHYAAYAIAEEGWKGEDGGIVTVPLKMYNMNANDNRDASWCGDLKGFHNKFVLIKK